jgi:carboxymethylenebutenolidase
MSVVNFALSRVIVRGIAPQARDRPTAGHIHGALAMKTTEPQIPSEAIEAYNLYIHGEIDRRSFFDRINKVAVSAVAATAMVDALMPNYAAAQQVSPTDSRLKTEYATVPSPQGNGTIKGYLARPASAGSTKLPSILVVHENRGLNPHIEDVARRLALENFMAFAPDGLTSVGGYPGDDAKGGELFGKVDRAKMSEDLYAAAVWLKSRPDSTGKLGVTGFCFGGGIANALAVRMGADLAAAVPFYGGAPMAADVPKIKAAVLVHHGGEDARLVAAWPEYESALKAAKVPYEGHIYPGAVHGFNNDATPQRYNKAAADEAWKRTVAWFNKYVRG